jgi:RNA polymerase sigma-70 factor (ECF subfamily)
MDNQSQALDDSYDPPDNSYAVKPEEYAMQEVRIRLIRQLIGQLPEKQRSCMQLREFEGKSYKEIAQVMDISEEQVKINIFRARQTIKQRYIKSEQYGL